MENTKEIIESLEKFGRGEKTETVLVFNPDNLVKVEPPNTVKPEELKEFEESFQAWGKNRQKFK